MDTIYIRECCDPNPFERSASPLVRRMTCSQPSCFHLPVSSVHPPHVTLADPSRLTRSGSAFFCLLRSLHVYIICSTSSNFGLRHQHCRSQESRPRLLHECERPQCWDFSIQTRPSSRIESPCSERSTFWQILLLSTSNA